MLIETAVDAHAILKETASRRIGAYVVGELFLANFTHDLDHESKKQAALRGKFETLPRASQALMLFGLESAKEFNFNPRQAFTDRLTNLRDRFGIPQPN